MAHIHSVKDTDVHYKIDGVSRTITNVDETKRMLVQNDHNSERLTFEVPRYIDGHDLTTCNLVQVHFTNSDIYEKNFSRGVYEVDDLGIKGESGEDANIVILTWLVSSNATKYVGTLNFSLRFSCVTDSKIGYAWGTTTFKGINIVEGVYNSDQLVEENIDVLEKWKNEMLAEYKNGPVLAVSVAKNEGNDYYTPSHTAAEIKAWGDNDGVVVLVHEGRAYDIVNPTENGVQFRYKEDMGSGKVQNCIFTIYDENANYDCPAAIYNTELECNPFIDSAEVGQAFVVKEVDASGKPIKFGAVDFPTGTGVSVIKYGAGGKGSTDDTAAFKTALDSERVVYVPGGVYNISSGLTIRDNCCLELSQDTVLNFTNTTGNCITLGMLSNLKGNFATVKVPYAFSGNVVYAYSNDHTDPDTRNVPPFTKWDPQWKSGRYLSNLNICKADSRGFHYAVNPGDCKGAAVYLSADNTQGLLGFMWGIRYTGLRIAGAFTYGVRAVNMDGGWMHEMCIDAFIDGCEIGVSLEDCNNAYVSAVIQPRPAYTLDEVYKPYAKHGIELIRSKNADLSGSRVWDWNAKNTLWTDGGKYQHIAMTGECRGAIINDFFYYETSIDIRKQIYTDYASNLEQMVILQEPIDRWFKVRNGEPYFSDGQLERKLITEQRLRDHFETGYVKHFTDVLPNAIDTDGSIYNEVGYRNARADSMGGNIENDSAYYMMTGFIACNKSSMIDVAGFSFAKGDENCRIILFDASFKYVNHVNRGNLIKGNNYFVKYTEKEDGFTCQLGGTSELNSVAYVRFIVHRQTWSDHPMVAVNEYIEYVVEGFLGKRIYVRGENVIGQPGVETPDWIAKKKEEGGNVVVISEQTITSSMWSQRQYDIIPGIIYEVFINGTRYTCEARNVSDGIVLGNNTAMNENEYPFCVFWAGGSAASGFFFKSSALSYPLTLKVTDNIVEVYDKMPVDYLPEEAALKTDIPTGGGGVDVTASVGQTIVVKEVDSNGKPTKWEAVDYQEKICETIEKAFLETTEVAFVQDPESGLYVAVVACDNTPEENVVYRVIFNGVTYENTYNTEMSCIGNLGLLGVGEDTGEPYIMSFIEGVINVISIVEIASATVGIVYDFAQPFDEEWLPDVPFYDLEADGFKALTYNDEGSYYAVSQEFCSFAQKAYKRGGGVLRVSALISPGDNKNAASIRLLNYSCRVHEDIGDYFIWFEHMATRWEIRLYVQTKTVKVVRYSFVHSEVI